MVVSGNVVSVFHEQRFFGKPEFILIVIVISYFIDNAARRNTGFDNSCIRRFPDEISSTIAAIACRINTVYDITLAINNGNNGLNTINLVIQMYTF